MTTAPAAATVPSRRLAWLVTGAFVLAGSIMLIDPFTDTTQSPPPSQEFVDEPDLYMEDAVITQYRPAGDIKYKLAADQIRRFENDNLTRLVEPRLQLYRDVQPPWVVASRHGYVRNRPNAAGTPEEVVFLRENVVLSRHYDDGRHLRLQTPSLHVFPDRHYAETDQNVMIDTDVGRTTAVGLKGDLQRELLFLSSTARERVHTIVLPGQFK